jgi:hypothetical protein
MPVYKPTKSLRQYFVQRNTAGTWPGGIGMGENQYVSTNNVTSRRVIKANEHQIYLPPQDAINPIQNTSFVRPME